MLGECAERGKGGPLVDRGGCERRVGCSFFLECSGVC